VTLATEKGQGEKKMNLVEEELEHGDGEKEGERMKNRGGTKRRAKNFLRLA